MPGTAQFRAKYAIKGATTFDATGYIFVSSPDATSMKPAALKKSQKLAAAKAKAKVAAKHNKDYRPAKTIKPTAVQILELVCVG